MIRVLLIGCGDVALRTADLLRPQGPPLRTHAPRRGRRRSCARTASCRSSATSTDSRRSARLRAAPFAVLHFAPPPSEGRDDPRTQKLIAALARARSIPQRFVYISTSGVYGDCAGARVDETRPRRAQTPRARRRVAAEDRLRDWATRYGVRARRSCARRASTRRRGCRSSASGRARRCSPPDDDVFTNHIHADDLARATVAALFRAQAQPRLQRHRRRRDEDGRLVRRRRRRVPAAAAAARVVGGGRAAHRADAAVVHERIAAAFATRG